MTQILGLILLSALTLTCGVFRVAAVAEEHDYDQPVTGRGSPCRWNRDCEWGDLCRAPRADASPLCLASGLPMGSECTSHVECAAYRSICNASRVCGCPPDHQDWTTECVPTIQTTQKLFQEGPFPPYYGEKCTFDEGDRTLSCQDVGLVCVSLYYNDGHDRCVRPAGLHDYCYTDMDCFARNPGAECVPLTSSTLMQCACKKGFVPFGKGCTAAGDHLGGILLIWGGTIVALASVGCVFLLILGMVLLCKGWCCCNKSSPTHPKVTSVGQLMKFMRWTKPNSEHYYRPLPDHPDNDLYLTAETPGVGIFYRDPPGTSGSADEIDVNVSNIPEPKIRYSRAAPRQQFNI